MKELKEKLQKALMDAKAICDAAEKAGRDFTDSERQQVTGYLAEAKAIKAQIAAKEADDDARRQIADLGKGLEGAPIGGGAQGAKVLSLGERFVQDAAIKAWFAQFPEGKIPDSVKGLRSPVIQVKDMGILRKAVLVGGSDTSAGAFVETDFTGIYEPLPRLPVVLRDLIAVRRTGSDTIEFVRQTAHAGQAATVAESNVSTYSGTTGQVEGAKPEATITWEKVQETVKTIAVWVPATKRALSDVGQLRSLIDADLRGDLADEVEDQIANGDGTGENMTGILNTSGVLTQAYDTDLFTTTRKAKTAVMQTGRAMPNAIVMNPADWETIELTQDGQNRYYYGGPLSVGEKRLWGLPVVECAAIAEGQAIIGDFRKACMWDREQATISVSDSHSDFFVRNMVAILAELRAAFALTRPAAFCIIDMAAGS